MTKIDQNFELPDKPVFHTTTASNQTKKISFLLVIPVVTFILILAVLIFLSQRRAPLPLSTSGEISPTPQPVPDPQLEKLLLTRKSLQELNLNPLDLKPPDLDFNVQFN